MRPNVLALTLASGLFVASSAHADEVDVCANAYEAAQRDHKSGDLRASIAEATTCARDVCPEILRRDCASWSSQWRAEERAANEKVEAAKPPPPAPKATAKEAKEPAPPVEATAPERPIPTLTWMLGAAGVAAVGVSSVFAVKGIGVRNDLQRENCSPNCDPTMVDRGRRDFLIADVTGAAGAALLGGALIVYLTRPPATKETKSAHAEVAPALGGVLVQGTF